MLWFEGDHASEEIELWGERILDSKNTKRLNLSLDRAWFKNMLMLWFREKSSEPADHQLAVAIFPQISDWTQMKPDGSKSTEKLISLFSKARWNLPPAFLWIQNQAYLVMKDFRPYTQFYWIWNSSSQVLLFVTAEIFNTFPGFGPIWKSNWGNMEVAKNK